jgi:fatty-acyl-CoA synthase
VVVVKAGHSITEEAMISHCRERLAHFKVPKRVILTQDLPKNPSGKILKRELRQRYATACHEAGGEPV